jgi:Bacterial Ig-like domain (group 2)
MLEVNRKISLMLVWCVLILVACPGSGGNTNTGNTVSVEIFGNPKDTTFLVGAIYDVLAFALNANGKQDPVGSINLSYVSSDPNIASVSGKYAQGKVTALKVGTTTLTAKVGSIQSKPLLLKVIANDPNAVPALPNTTTAVGKVLQFSDSNVNIDSSGGSFSSDDGILTVVVPAGAFAPRTGASFEISKLENKGIAAGEAKTLFSWIVQTDGSYEAVVVPFGLLLEGDYTYHYNEIYPCGDRAQHSAIDKQNKATMMVGLDNSNDVKTVGVTDPINPRF